MINANIIIGKYIDRKGYASVMLQVTINRKVKRYTLFKCLPADFDTKRQKLKNNHNRENAIINETLSKVNNINLMLAQRGESASFETFEANMQQSDNITWETVLQKYATQKMYAVAVRRFCNIFPNICFTKVTQDIAERFAGILEQQQMRPSSIHIYIKALATIYNKATDKHDYNGANPFAKIRTTKLTRERQYLTDAELQTVTNMQLPKRLISDRDVFLFQCYTGLRTSDVRRLLWTDINDGAITIRQQKTKRAVYIPLSSHAQAILERQPHDRQNVFKANSDVLYGRNMKQIMKLANIDKHITPHCGRHTFAVQSLNRRIPIEVVSRLLGHTDLKTTQIYAKVANPLIKDYMKLWE